MKETSLVSSQFFRMHSPKWAYMPTSGSGAAKQGGRANRKDIPALYLAADTATAIAEYQQTDSILPPGTLVSYQVNLARVIDFSPALAMAGMSFGKSSTVTGEHYDLTKVLSRQAGHSVIGCWKRDVLDCFFHHRPALAG